MGNNDAGVLLDNVKLREIEFKNSSKKIAEINQQYFHEDQIFTSNLTDSEIGITYYNSINPINSQSSSDRLFTIDGPIKESLIGYNETTFDCTCNSEIW
ncbi:hypothetical protein HC766_05405 [Candidatus Gracilibacteria bacterium]|nr:hypothetical protein [Candidatus Gracilibacteria bacterium]